MLTKNQLKYYSSLLSKKGRKEEKKFLVEGPKLIYSALSSGYKYEIILATNDFLESNLEFEIGLHSYDVQIDRVKSLELSKLTETKNPQGIVGIFLAKENIPSLNSNFIVALETINDPGNLGTILRNCDWFGVNAVILNDECAELFNPKVIRASAGSVFHLDCIEEKCFLNKLQALKNDGYKILCADLNGENVSEFRKPKKTILVLANEANGPSENLLKIVDQTITIPGKGKAESLNVASASAIILSELTK